MYHRPWIEDTVLENVVKKRIRYQTKDRREGDVEISIASIDRANEVLQWKPKLNIQDACEHTVKWIQFQAAL